MREAKNTMIQSGYPNGFGHRRGIVRPGKPQLDPVVGQHYYCKVRKILLVCDQLMFSGGAKFRRFEPVPYAANNVWFIAPSDLHTLRHVSEMEVIARAAR